MIKPLGNRVLVERVEAETKPYEKNGAKYKTLEEAKYVKARLIEEDWDKKKLDSIRDEINIKPLRRYNYE